MSQLKLSAAIEELMVSRDLRHMARVREVLQPGYYLRAAQSLMPAKRVLIATGFPVGDTFETDGPLGAIALYRSLERLGAQCTLACANPLAAAIASDFDILRLEGFDHASALLEAETELARLQPDCIVCIERPGLAKDGRYYNMRGIDISERCAIFDYYVEARSCPSVAIGDGGNEIGMGSVRSTIDALDITAAETRCDELLVADVSNWGAYGLIAMLESLSDVPLLPYIDHLALLAYLSQRDSVDGVTGNNTLTEDGLPAEDGQAILNELHTLLRTAKETASA